MQKAEEMADRDVRERGVGKRRRAPTPRTTPLWPRPIRPRRGGAPHGPAGAGEAERLVPGAGRAGAASLREVERLGVLHILAKKVVLQWWWLGLTRQMVGSTLSVWRHAVVTTLLPWNPSAFGIATSMGKRDHADLFYFFRRGVTEAFGCGQENGLDWLVRAIFAKLPVKRRSCLACMLKMTHLQIHVCVF